MISLCNSENSRVNGQKLTKCRNRLNHDLFFGNRTVLIGNEFERDVMKTPYQQYIC